MRLFARYLRLWIALGRYGLAREMAFRSNFVVKISVEIIWLFILLAFYGVIFSKTDHVADWSRSQYLFFLGCYFALEGLLETLFLENCVEFGELIRTGDLDFFLLKPIDEQFLVTCRSIDWSTSSNLLMGASVMGIGLAGLDWSFDAQQAATFFVTF